jgi:asparagine synthase (glutamine-hydrolysing)
MRYWRPAPAEQQGEWIERVREEVTAAVRKRLVADVPLGALLSGGLDSSIVVGAMAAASPEPVRTFTIGFPDRRYDEREYARAVAERYGTTHEELEVDPGPELLDRVAEAFDEPLGDEAALPMLLVCEATRRHVTVALVGDGGDEAFGGYERYRAHALAGRVPRFAASLGSTALGAVTAARREPRSSLFRARRFLDVAARPASERYARLVEVFPLELRRELWTDEARAHAARTMLPDDPDLRIVDMESYLPGDLLPKSDIASMAVSLELRAPFLDHRVIELGLALPAELARGKRALKEAFAADLPPEIAGRGKTGFGVPLDEWFRGPLRETAEELLLGRDRGLFHRPALEQLLREHVERRADHGHRLWCLCMLELWQRRYVDAGAPVLAAA